MPVSVLIRPHPMETRSWVKELGTDGEGITTWREGSVVWPIGAGHPTLPAGQADFFDTLYHADAVVGLNTSAMIEAAILGKPVMTFLGHGLRRSQTGNLHFRYLKEGGFLFVGKSLDQHVKQLWRVLNGAEPVADGCHRFVADFVRPFGREVAASDLLVEHILEAMVHAARLRAPHGEMAPTPALTGT
jgi:hypothetical protein